MKPLSNIYNAISQKIIDKKYQQHLNSTLVKQQEETRIYMDMLNDKSISPETYAYISNKHMLSVLKENFIMKEILKFK